MEKPKVVVLTGAGLSADSGIATYRGAGGIYKGVQAEKIMSASGLKKDPELVHAMCDDRRVEMGDVEPNPAHLMLAELSSRYGDRFIHFTQNIDDLAERAGVVGSHHVHGELTLMRSIGNSKITKDIGYSRYWSGSSDQAPDGGYQFRCPVSKSYFRPAVVLFDEMAPLYPKLFRTMKRLRREDLLLVIGTEGVVLPINQWASMTFCKKVLNNLHDSNDIDDDQFDIYIRDRAGQVADRILEITVSHLGAA